jgi:hypothetical protein
MIKLFVLVIVLLTSAPTHLFASTASQSGGRDYRFDLRAFKEFRKVDLMAEIGIIDNAFHETSKHAQLVGRYVFTDAFKIGLFVQGAMGLRHDDDWVLISPDNWRWKSTKSRLEPIVGPEVNYRHWLGQSLWAFELRGRYYYNAHNSFQKTMVRTSLMRFLDHGALSISSEAFIPLNYSTHTVDEFWFYLGHQYSLRSNLTLGHTLAWGEQRWSEPKAYPTAFKQNFKTLRFMLNMNFYL